MNWSETKVVVTGGAGFLGQPLCAMLRDKGCTNLHVPRKAQYDLTDEAQVVAMYDEFKPDMVIHLAADVGGIGANQKHPGRFFYSNMAMGLHLIEHARRRSLGKFVQVGTVCAYPKFTPVPFREADLWNGYPEETNAPYGVAKKALFVMLDAYHREFGLASSVVLPTNLYGPRDNFDLESSHVIPALIRKCVEAILNGDDTLECWGTGNISREFLYVDDAAEGIVAAAERIDEPTPINLGRGEEVTIRDLAIKIAELTGFEGKFDWNSDRPDGQPRRCLDTTQAAELLTWTSETTLEDGLTRTINWYRDSIGAPTVAKR